MTDAIAKHMLAASRRWDRELFHHVDFGDAEESARFLTMTWNLNNVGEWVYKESVRRTEMKR